MRKAHGLLRQALDPSTNSEVGKTYMSKMMELLRSTGMVISVELEAKSLEVADERLAILP